jgi:putative transposase
MMLHSPDGTVVHSDLGSQFRSREFMRTFKNNNLTDSKGQFGAGGNNVEMRSFFAQLHKSVLDRQRVDNREELRVQIIT